MCLSIGEHQWIILKHCIHDQKYIWNIIWVCLNVRVDDQSLCFQKWIILRYPVFHIFSQTPLILVGWLSYIECHPTVTASNGFPCLRQNLEEHKHFFFLLPTFSISEKNRSWRILFPHVWELPLICGKHWFKFWIRSWVWQILDLHFWIPCCVLRSLDEHFGLLDKKYRSICNISTDMFYNPSKQCQRHWVSFCSTHVSLSPLSSSFQK